MRFLFYFALLCTANALPKAVEDYVTKYLQDVESGLKTCACNKENPCQEIVSTMYNDVVPYKISCAEPKECNTDPYFFCCKDCNNAPTTNTLEIPTTSQPKTTTNTLQIPPTLKVKTTTNTLQIPTTSQPKTTTNTLEIPTTTPPKTTTNTLEIFTTTQPKTTTNIRNESISNNTKSNRVEGGQVIDTFESQDASIDTTTLIAGCVSAVCIALIGIVFIACLVRRKNTQNSIVEINPIYNDKNYFTNPGFPVTPQNEEISSAYDLIDSGESEVEALYDNPSEPGIPLTPQNEEISTSYDLIDNGESEVEPLYENPNDPGFYQTADQHPGVIIYEHAYSVADSSNTVHYEYVDGVSPPGNGYAVPGGKQSTV